MQSLREDSGVTNVEIARIVNEIIRNLSTLDPVVNPRVGQVEPATRLKRAGQLGYADGTNWNPNSTGEGEYIYLSAGAWRLLTFLDSSGLLATGWLGTGTASASKVLYGDRTWGAKPIFTKSYDSGVQTITSGGALTLAHGLGELPKMLHIWLQCTQADANYAVGDKVMATNELNTGSLHHGVSIVVDATNLNVRFGSAAGVFALPDKTTGNTVTLTNTRWNIIFDAWA